MAWFWRGTQSAIFYYLSCAPCTGWAYRHKQQRENKRARNERDESEEGVYRHPLPFNTNTYWQEEMTLGPGPTRRGHKGKADSARRLNTGGQGSSADASSLDTTLVMNSLDGVENMVEARESGGEGWNVRRYQRPDELLWGLNLGLPGHGKGVKSTTSMDSETYFPARNPAVNDLHPPVVSTHPAKSEELRWMLQPPPPAKIMEGKERDNRSRSGSNGSRGSRASHGRKRGEGNALAQPIPALPRLPGLHDPAESQDCSLSKQNTPCTPPGRRDGQERGSISSPSSLASPRRKQPPPPIIVSEDGPMSGMSRDIIRASSSRSTAGEPRSRRSRPALTTIQSSSHNAPTLHNLEHSTKSRNLHPADGSRPRPMSEVNPIEMEGFLPVMGSKFPGQETFRFPPEKREEPRDVSMRWSMDI